MCDRKWRGVGLIPKSGFKLRFEYRAHDAERLFDAVHGRDEDPWGYAGTWYEQRKRALTLAALPEQSYEAGLEIGCSIGTLNATPR